MKKILILITGLLVFSACGMDESEFKSDVPVIRNNIDVFNYIPSEINLNVPFFPQAPDGDWNMPWQESCEEASVVLAYYYATGQKLTKEKFKGEILKLVEWQTDNFGQYEHTNIDQTNEMMKENFEILATRLHVIKNPTISELKYELAQGNVIIAPFSGRMLGNPFYSGEGPYYHMMIVKGYDENRFITNDVGTKRGENFIYPYNVIMSAMHNWHDEDISLGEKKVIVIEPLSFSR